MMRVQMLGRVSRVERVTDMGGGLLGCRDVWRWGSLDVSSARCNTAVYNNDHVYYFEFIRKIQCSLILLISARYESREKDSEVKDQCAGAQLAPAWMLVASGLLAG